ncbi:DUF1848 family protein [Clostridium oryzae]|uniref:DUF1848 domain-containing protein n=1 Tax=Clostridium oryzae TaxID=1450648 RepID=A0A1V4I4D8_9CLOT|nr:DUF1848 family protein [Clostridium oryzae]OPJ54836.1 hypothetical protein CLORY_45000 [Clostridium oryzae]
MDGEQINLFGDTSKNKKVKIKNVISASRRTDIPAFFYDWFQQVLNKGFVELVNPRFQDKTYTVDLTPENVHSIVLWSKNFNNVLRNPMNLENYNLYFEYTINNYSKKLEPNVPEYKDTLYILGGLLKKYKPEQFNIRFDPIIISVNGEKTPTPDKPEKARLLAFETLCRDIKMLGMENCRVTTSYLSLYGHVKKNIENSSAGVIHLNEHKQILFFEQMVEIADKYGITIYSCASPVLQQVEGIKEGHCIEGALLEQLFGGRVRKGKDTGQRKTCGCSYSRDIGVYAKGTDGMKCRHGCVYCYA